MARGLDEADDIGRRQRLATSVKDSAENVLIGVESTRQSLRATAIQA